MDAKQRRRALVGAAGGAGIALAAAVGYWATQRRVAVPAAVGAAGEMLGAELAELVRAAPGWRVPARCMEASEDAPAPARLVVGPREYALDASQAYAGGDASRQRAVLGVVADARGALPETLRGARTAAQSFAGAHVDVVLSLGGEGTTRAEIEPVLEALAGDGSWLLVALPGDRDPIAAHREAVAALAAKGAKIVDGSALGLVVVDGVAIALVPGAPAGGSGHAAALVAGADGCARTSMDLEALAARLGEPTGPSGPHVVAAHRAPRQRGLDATDLALGGIHVGEVALADLAAHVGAVAFVHGDLDETGGRAVHATWGATSTVVSQMTWSERLVVATGPLEALPHQSWTRPMRDSGAVVVEIDHMRARVRLVRATARNPGTLQ